MLRPKLLRGVPRTRLPTFPDGGVATSGFGALVFETSKYPCPLVSFEGFHDFLAHHSAPSSITRFALPTFNRGSLTDILHQEVTVVNKNTLGGAIKESLPSL